MKKLLLLPLALVSGFGITFAAAGLHSMFFVLLPTAAFAFGYLSSWGLGLACGFLLLAGSSLAGALMWHGGTANLLVPIQYVAAFMLGGFSLPLLGWLGSLSRSGIRTFESIVAISVLVFAALGAAYLAVKPYGYYFQVIVHSTQDLDGIELYLPLATRSGKPYGDLLEYPHYVPGVGLSESYTAEQVETEHGPMLKLVIHDMQPVRRPDFAYAANVILWQKAALSWEPLYLKPKLNTVSVQTVDRQERLGPIVTSESRTIEVFDVPMMVKASTEAQVQVTIENRTDRESNIAFGFSKYDPYRERITYSGRTGDGWLFGRVEARSVLNIRGIGD